MPLPNEGLIRPCWRRKRQLPIRRRYNNNDNNNKNNPSFPTVDSKNQGIKGTSSGTYTDSVAGASICMSLCAVSTKGSDLDHKPTLPPPNRVSNRHAHTQTHLRTLTLTHPHTHTHTPIHPHTQKTHRGQMMINVRKCNCVGLTGALANLERETSERSSFVGLHDPGSNH